MYRCSMRLWLSKLIIDSNESNLKQAGRELLRRSVRSVLKHNEIHVDRVSILAPSAAHFLTVVLNFVRIMNEVIAEDGADNMDVAAATFRSILLIPLLPRPPRSPFTSGRVRVECVMHRHVSM